MDNFEGYTSENLPTSPTPDFPSQSPIDQAEIQDLLVAYPFASEPSYFTRPNRYHGPPSTWRSWTANDRDVAESLDIARARNLSVHLYNAFDLKRRGGADPGAIISEARAHTDGDRSPDDGQEAVGQQFTVPEVWTAWPMRSRHVPRESQLQLAANLSQARTQRHIPSTGLADALLAITLRHAREIWDKRSEETKQPQVHALQHDWKLERDLTKKELKARGAAIDDSPQSTDGDSIESEAALTVEDSASLDEDLPQGTQLFSSQAFAAAESSSSEDESSTNDSKEDCPVFSADEDSARNLLQPSIRHILTKLDSLLDGLHKARAAYAMKEDDSCSRSRSAFSGANVTEDENLVRSGSRAASIKRRRKRKRVPSESQDTEQQRTSRSRGRSAVRKSEKTTATYAPRDWSDVMGMATLTGWNIETVARASERCARLFDQNMTFRTFYQGKNEKVVGTQEEPWFEDESAYVPASGESRVRNMSQDALTKTQSRRQKTVECVRASSQCSRCRSFRLRCQPLNPVSIDDTTKRVACAACSSTSNLETPCSGIVIQPQTKPAAKTCPYPDCVRHSPAKPFAKNYHLQRHLTDVHGHFYSPPSSPAPSRVIDDDKVDQQIEGQVRPSPTLTCPVPFCPHSARVFKRSTRLYDHIRKAHPEFDVASLKKIVAKSGDRGRYDRSRSRSRQATAQNEGADLENQLEKQDERVETLTNDDNALQNEESDND